LPDDGAIALAEASLKVLRVCHSGGWIGSSCQRFLSLVLRLLHFSNRNHRESTRGPSCRSPNDPRPAYGRWIIDPGVLNQHSPTTSTEILARPATFGSESLSFAGCQDCPFIFCPFIAGATVWDSTWSYRAKWWLECWQ
jgi:hypothetical protein